MVSWFAHQKPVISFRNNNSLAIWIKENLLPVKTHAAFRFKRSGDAVGIYLPCHNIRYKNMPVVIGFVFLQIERRL